MLTDSDTSARTVTDGKRSFIGHSLCRLAIKVKAGNTGCNITCPEMEEALADAAGTYKTGVIGVDKKGLFEGEQSNPNKDYDANGDMYLTWYVQISNKNVSSQPFNFTLTNQLNSQDDYITHFQLKVADPRLSPLWYMATGNVKSTTKVNGVYEFGQPTEVGVKLLYEAASTFFAAGGKNANYNGWRAANIPGPDGIMYHMPSRNELCSLVPDGVDADDQYVQYDILSTTNFPVTSEGSLFSEISTSCWGFDETTKAGIHSKTYWGTPSINGNISKRCAIRFIGTDYCSLWYYELNKSSGYLVTMKSKAIGRIETSESNTLKELLAAIESPTYDWSEANDVVIRQFYNDSDSQQFHSTTWRAQDNHGLAAGSAGIYIYPHGNRTQSQFPTRLFRDE